MLLQILDYDLNIVYQETSKMHLSNALSRLSTHQPNKGLTLPGMDITVHEIETCTNFSALSLDKIREATLQDQDLQVLKSHITNGFPISTNQCPECIRPFFPYRDELTVYNGLLLKGNCIVIPTELCNQLLNVIHESHLGICKTLDWARTSIFWPEITNDIKKFLSHCRACVQHQDKQPNKSIVSDPELKPWTSLSIDNFEYKGRHYLIILDRCTKFVVVKHVHSYNAGTTVETMCEVFSEFGLPENIHSDRGRNFLSSQFTQFLNDLGIDLTFCSAYHHSSNPAECAIRNVKNLMKHCGTANKPWHILLLKYLATPLSTGLPSPAAMMGKGFRGLLRHLQHFLPDSTKELLVQCHENQVCPGGHDLSDIPIGSNVMFLDHRMNEWYPVKVQNQEAHSYILTTEQGHTISHNHVDIRPTNVKFTLRNVKVRANFPVGTKESVSKTPISICQPVHISTPKPNVSSTNKHHSTPVTRNSVTTTHSGCVVKPPNKLNL